MGDVRIGGHEIKVDEFATIGAKVTEARPGGVHINYQPYEWEMRFCAGNNVVWCHHNAPNRFHRFMQRIFFGFVWSSRR